MEYLKKGFEYNTVFEGVTMIIEATPQDANEEEKKDKQFCIVMIKQASVKGFKNFRKVVTIQELKDLIGMKKKERIVWE